MALRRRRRVEAPAWDEVVAILWREPTFERRLDALLELVGGLLALPDAYVYLVDDSGRRLRLTQVRARLAADPTRAPPGPLAQTLEGGSEAAAPLPPLELARSEEDDEPRIVTSPIGRLYSLPLTRAGELVGVVQIGPVGDERAQPEPLRRWEAVRAAASLVVERAHHDERLRQRYDAMAARLEASQRLAGSALDVERFVSLLLDLALASTGTSAGFVATVDADGQGMHVRARAGLPDDFGERVDLSPDSGLFDWALADGGSLILRDLEAATELGISAILAVPLLADGRPLGIFALVSLGEPVEFDEHGLTLLATFAEQVKLMLHNARLFDDFARQYVATVEGLAESLDARRPHLAGHHRKVSEAAVELAKAVGLGAEQVAAIRTAGLIHDVGLAGVSELDGADFEHPTVGASLIEHLPLHPSVTAAIAAHHEWYDGWGFPGGIKGEDIPFAGRVLAVAEFLVEMGSGDPVRRPWDVDQLVAEIEQRRGSQFDPELADAAVTLLRDGQLVPAPSVAIEEV